MTVQDRVEKIYEDERGNIFSYLCIWAFPRHEPRN